MTNYQLFFRLNFNFVGSLLSDLSFSRSEDDLDVSLLQRDKVWRKHRPSTDKLPEPPNKKRRSTENKVVEVMMHEKKSRES